MLGLDVFGPNYSAARDHLILLSVDIDCWFFLCVCVNRLTMQAMKQLHPETIAAIQGKSLFSQNEENLLAKVQSVGTSVSPCD